MADPPAVVWRFVADDNNNHNNDGDGDDGDPQRPPVPKKAKVSPDSDDRKGTGEESSSSESESSSGEEAFTGRPYTGSDYDGLVICCIRVVRVRSAEQQEQEQEQQEQFVEFSETDGPGDEAVLLSDLREIPGRRAVRRYRAKLLDNNAAGGARALIGNDRIPLICVHGYESGYDPSGIFDRMEARNRHANRGRTVREVFASVESGSGGGGKLVPVPVLWPRSVFGWVTHRFLTGQQQQQQQQQQQRTETADDGSRSCRRVFRMVTTLLGTAFPGRRVSLMAHGSGCHRVLHGCCSYDDDDGDDGDCLPEVRFEDIFLVAAVRTDDCYESR